MYGIGALLLALAPSADPLSLGEASGEDVVLAELRYRVRRTWPEHYPECTWFWVQGLLELPGAGGRTFAASEQPDHSLKIDTTGNGRLDRHLREPGVVVFRWRDENGRGEYALRFKPEYNRPDRQHGWYFAQAGAIEGKIGTLPVAIVDTENSGRYDDFGVDALVVGRDVQSLQEVFAARDDLFALRPRRDRGFPELEPYTGPAGRLDLRSGLPPRARLARVKLVHEASEVFFDLREPGVTRLPTGSYRLASAQVAADPVRFDVERGTMAAFDVRTDQTVELSWGSPLRLGFTLRRAGEFIELTGAVDEGQGASVAWIGAAGERYRVSGVAPVKYEVELRTGVARERESGSVPTAADLVGLRFEAPRGAQDGLEVTLRVLRTPAFGTIEGRALLAPDR